MPKSKTIRKLAELTYDNLNANRGTERGAALLENSLREYGAGRSILLDRNGKIIAGNKTVEQAGSIGLDDVVVVQTDGTKLVAVQRTDLDLDRDPRAKALAIADNRVGQVDLEWDPRVLADLSEEIDLSKFWSDDELNELLSREPVGTGEAPEPQLDRAEELQGKWKTAKGQMWAIESRSFEGGAHRLMCGDSACPGNVARLLGDCRPALMVTDPPYGVNYDPEWRNEHDLGGNGKWVGASRATGKVTNDDRLDWSEVFALFPGDVAYIWHAGVFASEVAAQLAKVNFEIRAQIIWAKQHFVFGRGHYHWQHEPCWYAVRKGKAANWAGDRKQTTLWEISNLNPMGGNAEEESTGHGTQKPVECMRRPIANHTLVGDSVYEPFSGSGTTFCAAEQMARLCYGMEIEPKYVAVALQRLEDMGLAPRLVK
jgi:DNA modification methylase